MNHDTMVLLVSTWVDGEATDSESVTVLAHLEECPACRQVRDSAMKLREELRSWDEIRVSPGFSGRVMHAVQKYDKQSTKWLGIEPLARRTVWAIAVVVLLLFVLTSYRDNSTPGFSEQYFSGTNSDPTAAQVLLQQDAISKNDLLYAAMTK